MNYKMIFKVLGYLLLIIALGMFPSLLIAVFSNQHDMIPFVISIFLTAMTGLRFQKYL